MHRIQKALDTQAEIRKLGGKYGYFYFNSMELAEEVLKAIGQDRLIHMVKNGVAL